MDIVLHIGAHRCGSTTFQHYMRGQQGRSKAKTTGYWGPQRTRGGLFSGLFPHEGPKTGRNLPRRAEGRVKLALAQAEARGVQALLVSDENMIGTPRACLRSKQMYPAIGDRMARVASAFDHRISRILLTIRAQDLWWSSVSAYAVGRGMNVPSAQTFDQIAGGRRTWRDVITDLACAVPDTEILVTPFETIAGQPDALLTQAHGAKAPPDPANRWLNRAPDLPKLRAVLAERGGPAAALPDATGRWNPFTRAQVAALQENYEDDLFWLMAGADGLAHLTQDQAGARAGSSPPPAYMTKGHGHDRQTDATDVAHSG